MSRRMADHLALSAALCFLFLVLCTCQTTSANSTGCSSGFTGTDSGGSCSFTSATFCDYTNAKGRDTIKWKSINENEIYFVHKVGDSFSNRAILESPVMCEKPKSSVCLGFSFRYTCKGGGFMNVSVCRLDVCKTIFRADEDNYNHDSWINQEVEFISGGFVQVRFEAGVRDTWGFESDTYLDEIKYNPGKCSSSPQASTPVTASPRQASTGTSPLPHSASSGSSRDPGKHFHWTTLASTQGTDVTHHEDHYLATSDALTPPADHSKTEGEGDNTAPNLVTMVTIPVVLVLVVAVVVVSGFLVLRHKRNKSGYDQPCPDINYSTRRDSLIMINNEMYESADGHKPPTHDHPPAPDARDAVSIPDQGKSQRKLPQAPSVYYTSVEPSNARGESTGVVHLNSKLPPELKESQASDCCPAGAWSQADQNEDTYEPVGSDTGKGGPGSKQTFSNHGSIIVSEAGREGQAADSEYEIVDDERGQAADTECTYEIV